MSRIGRVPIEIPQGVEVKMDGIVARIKGPKGEMLRSLHPNMIVKVDGGKVNVSRPNDERLNKGLHGLTRTLVNNMILGVTKGFAKTLTLIGVGYKVELKGKDLVMQLGFSHPVHYPAPAGIQFEVDSKLNIVVIKGIDKEKVGQVAAEIRGFRPPEPYKGKGVLYQGEKVRRKAGKGAVGAGK